MESSLLQLKHMLCCTVHQEFREQTIRFCTLLGLLLNILDKVITFANSILHSSRLLSVRISPCSRKCTGRSRTAAFNCLMESMFKRLHTSALFSSVMQHLQYLHHITFSGLFSPFINHMSSPNWNCAPHPMKSPCQRAWKFFPFHALSHIYMSIKYASWLCYY